MLATSGKIHYDQSITTSYQYSALVIPQVQLTLSNHNEYDPQSIQNYSQLVAEQMIIENLLGKNTSSTPVIASFSLSLSISVNGTTITISKQLLPEDITMVVTGPANNSALKTLSV